MDAIILLLLSFQLQMKILHWQTKSFARHNAYGGIYGALTDLIDNFAEIYQGKYGRFDFSESGIEISNIGDIKIQDLLRETCDMLINDVADELDENNDSDLLNIRDEMLSEINKLKYLLSLD